MSDDNIFKKMILLPTSNIGLQFIRYVVVGGSATVLDYSLFMLCHRLAGMHLIASNTMGFVGGLIVNYILSTIWVFDSHNMRSKKAEFFIFTVVGLGGLGISHALLYISVEMLSIIDFCGKAIAVAGAMIWNFGIRKVLLFREPVTVVAKTDE